mgnify:CR=1 FL=1
MSLFTIRATIGETKKTVGNAIKKLKLHACSHINKILLTKPILNKLTTNDIMPDIKNDITKE